MSALKHLAATEARFQANVLSGDPAIDAEIGGDSEAFRDTRLGIYRDAYRLRLIESIHCAPPVVV